MTSQETRVPVSRVLCTYPRLLSLLDKEQIHHCQSGMSNLWILFIMLSSTKFTPENCVTELYICKKNPIICDVGLNFVLGCVQIF